MADTGKKPKYPCIKCRKNVPKTVKSVQCKTCLLWIHNECQNTVWIPANIYSIMADQASAGLGFFWHCESCLASSVRLEAAINQCELRVKEGEQRTERTEGLVKDLDRRMDKVESSNVRTEDKMMEIKEALKKEIYTEFRDRKQRQKNLVLHRVGEAGQNVKKPEDRRDWDLRSCNNIFEAMGTRVTSSAVQFCRRVGERGETPRRW